METIDISCEDNLAGVMLIIWDIYLQGKVIE